MRYPPDYLDLPAAWTGAEMATQEHKWIRTLSDAEVTELETAADNFFNRSSDLAALDKERFKLPTLAQPLALMRNELTAGIGFSLWRGLPVDRYSMEMCAAIFCGIGAHLGVARSQNARGHLLGHVKDVGGDLTNPNVRIYQTTERQSFHTDSTDVVGLLCLKEAMKGGDSLLASTVTLYNEMNRRDPELTRLMFEPLATDRRGEVPQGQLPWFEVPVLNWHEGFLSGLYQRTYIRSASRLEGAPRLSTRHEQALDLFDDIANDPDIHLSMRLQPGDMQFVYNHHMLHDRTAFTDWPNDKKRRHLLRLWLAIPGDRPLPPVYSQRYGPIEPGNRGGIITSGTRLNVPLAP